MIKQVTAIFVSAVFAVFFSGCGDENVSPRPAGKTSGVSDVLQSRMAESQVPEESVSAETVPAAATEPVPPAAESAAGRTGSSDPVPDSENADVDLTALSTTLVYPKVYEMTNVPQNYLGKTIKMSGQFAVYPNPNAEKKFFACVVADKAGCCQLGIEFELTGEHLFPDNYPEIGARITVIGRFDRYYEKYRPYFTLRDARLLEGLTLKELKALENEVR